MHCFVTGEIIYSYVVRKKCSLIPSMSYLSSCSELQVKKKVFFKKDEVDTFVKEGLVYLRVDHVKLGLGGVSAA